MKRQMLFPAALCGILLATFISCENKKPAGPDKTEITALNLRKGEVISCGPPEKEFGAVGFETSCDGDQKENFELGMGLLHSFEYDEAEKVFARIIDEEPGCAMAYWGVAMSNYHPLWAPPTPEEFAKGDKAIRIAQSIPGKTERETAYVDAMALFYKDWDKVPHVKRFADFEKAMEAIAARFPGDREASIFYALALTGGASPSDKTFSRQKKAVNILNALYSYEPNHPGIIHYIIHSYDSPELANLALDAARKYASIAPSSAHAQHMPSHIFTRLGLWEENIKSNTVAAASAKCYAESLGLKGQWDEELHAIDYLVYSYLQRGDNANALAQWNYIKTIKQVDPTNFKVAYAFAAIPSRYVLENKLWQEAARQQLQPNWIGWEKYPWQKAIHHFTRLMGAAHTGEIDSAKAEARVLQALHDELERQKDAYKANQVMIQMKTGQAWIAFKEGKTAEALKLMNAAANMEDSTEKHPVTPGEVLPAREMLGDMLLLAGQPAKALAAYEAELAKHPNRFNAIYGAAVAAEKSGDMKKASAFYRQLVTIAIPEGSSRKELSEAKQFLSARNDVAKK
jgi:tetratricopeptide (TPR) repeat protein